jgi:hypothetical protein
MPHWYHQALRGNKAVIAYSGETKERKTIIRRDNENGRRQEAPATISGAGALSRKGSSEAEPFPEVTFFQKGFKSASSHKI